MCPYLELFEVSDVWLGTQVLGLEGARIHVHIHVHVLEKCSQSSVHMYRFFVSSCSFRKSWRLNLAGTHLIMVGMLFCSDESVLLTH